MFLDKTDLNPLQQEAYDRLSLLFGDKKILEKLEVVLSKIRNTPELEYKVTDEQIMGLFNDIIYDSNLSERCIIPPFSVFDTKGGEWRKRKSYLDAYLGSSIAGRSDGLAYGDLKVRKDDNGTSQFDSVLTEVLLKWFGFKDCKVYDCFAGGHVRGTMAALLNYKYFGIELSTEQVAANVVRYAELKLGKELAVWVNDDSLNVDKYLESESQDLLFSCPPYGDLEKYTDDPRDLSNMEYEDFLVSYKEIIRKGAGKLMPDRFAVFVVGDFRDEKGYYRGFVADTIKAFEACGMKLYNEIILLNNIGTAPMRANMAFANRKVIKLHQNVLVFYKGNPSNIKNNFGDVDPKVPIPEATQAGLF